MDDRPLTNLVLRNFLRGMEEVLGQEGLAAMLRAAGRTQYLGNYPPANLATDVNFSDYARLNKAIEDFYGVGARNILNHIGRTVFRYELGAHAPLLTRLLLKILPQRTRLRVALNTLAKAWTERGDTPATVERFGDDFVFSLEHCPSGWGRQAKAPVCHVNAGYLEEAGLWAVGAPVDVEIIACHATGAPACRYRVNIPSAG